MRSRWRRARCSGCSTSSTAARSTSHAWSVLPAPPPPPCPCPCVPCPCPLRPPSRTCGVAHRCARREAPCGWVHIEVPALTSRAIQDFDAVAQQNRALGEARTLLEEAKALKKKPEFVEEMIHDEAMVSPLHISGRGDSWYLVC
eukprot:3932992-Rhodomonas_salina.3